MCSSGFASDSDMLPNSSTSSCDEGQLEIWYINSQLEPMYARRYSRSFSVGSCSSDSFTPFSLMKRTKIGGCYRKHFLSAEIRRI